MSGVVWVTYVGDGLVSDSMGCLYNREGEPRIVLLRDSVTQDKRELVRWF